MGAFERLIESLARGGVRFIVIGLSGANYYARSARALFATQDRDLFLPLDADNALSAWHACESVGLHLYCGDEPLDMPRDRFLAERVVANRALVRATDGAGLDVDLTLVMGGFDFDTVWSGRRIFRVDDVEIPVARLTHIVESKRRANGLRNAMLDPPAARVAFEESIDRLARLRNAGQATWTESASSPASVNSPDSFTPVIHDYAPSNVDLVRELLQMWELSESLEHVALGPPDQGLDELRPAQGFLKIQGSREQPSFSDVLVKLWHQGWWFYISASDGPSKAGFRFLQTLINMRLVEATPANIPTLTIPVGGK